MIKSFGNRITEDLYNGASNARVKRLPPDIKESALYKLDMLNAAMSLDDLRSPPGNQLESLHGDYAEFHSIRINAQWRIVFRWHGSSAYDVEIVDYH
ncbi:MAG TPA: type II toxin-antitoxin system RelE/ParE family toxin [Nitrococcus sp.]|nr:type II toxin-antitoxin system RelE/ParE family toxin [Nitrococcus sp.]